MQTYVYSVFPACGKTTIFNNQNRYGISVLDSDSSEFSWCMRKRTDEEAKEFLIKAINEGKPIHLLSEIEKAYDEILRLRNPEFPANYIEYIKQHMRTVKYIFVSSHKEVRQALKDAGIPYVLVYPQRECLPEWVGRCYLRQLAGNNGFPIEVLVNNWDEWIDQCDGDDGAVQKIRLGSCQYLADYILECRYS